MKKVVFFNTPEELPAALNQFDMTGFKGKKTPVKLHMGEMRNKYFPRPVFVKKIVEELKRRETQPYLFDTTVAYKAVRNIKKGYEKLAAAHGFTEKKIGCEIIIDDAGKPVEINNRTYEVADHLLEATHMFILSHVKGHVATGMGGAIKNLGMGGVTKKTKKSMHNATRPVHIKDKCTLCGICAELCPFNALTVKNDKWVYKKHLCFGCGVCVNVCENQALKFEEADLQYLLACAAKAVVKNKKVIYLNELKRISKSCDCDPHAGPIICPDIGYLLSDDPVAIDKASLDLINKTQKNVFIKHNHVNPIKQIQYGEEIKLGTTQYELIKI